MDFHSQDPAHLRTEPAAPIKTKNKTFNLKERYRLEADLLRKKLGPLESIRRDLGLSQRKMSELLLVDPASWNRWVRENRAPAYIYKSLQWFLALKERNPELASWAWIKTQAVERNTSHFESEITDLRAEIQSLRESIAINDKESLPVEVTGTDRFSSPAPRLRVSIFLVLLGMAAGWVLSQMH